MFISEWNMAPKGLNSQYDCYTNKEKYAKPSFFYPLFFHSLCLFPMLSKVHVNQPVISLGSSLSNSKNVIRPKSPLLLPGHLKFLDLCKTCLNF